MGLLLVPLLLAVVLLLRFGFRRSALLTVSTLRKAASSRSAGVPPSGRLGGGGSFMFALWYRSRTAFSYTIFGCSPSRLALLTRDVSKHWYFDRSSASPRILVIAPLAATRMTSGPVLYSSKARQHCSYEQIKAAAQLNAPPFLSTKSISLIRYLIRLRPPDVRHSRSRPINR